MEQTKFEWVYCALYIFCICGIVGVFIDLDHIWSMLGLQASINLSGWNSRPLHTPLVFIMAGIVVSGIITTLTHGSNTLGQCLELLDKRIERRISSLVGITSLDINCQYNNDVMVDKDITDEEVDRKD